MQKENNSDSALLQSLFNNNETLLRLIRTCLYGLDLSSEEREKIRGLFANRELLKIFTRRFIPSYDDSNVPIGQTLDLWAGVDIKSQSKESAKQLIIARHRLINLTKQGLDRLVNPDLEGISLQYNPDVTPDDELFTGFISRNSYLHHVETQLHLIKLVADQKPETPEETKKRIKKDSSK